MFYTKKIALILLITVFSIGIFYPISTSAQSSRIPTRYSYSGIKPFGGKITSMKVCTSGIMLEVGPPIGGQYLLTDSTKMYNYGVLAPGIWILGNADIGTVVCKGNGDGSGTIGTVILIAATAVSLYTTFGTNLVFHYAIGDTIIKVTLGQIAGAIGMTAFLSKFGFGEKLKILGHPHPIQIIGTGF